MSEERYVWYAQDDGYGRAITKHGVVKETATRLRLFGPRFGWNTPGEWTADKSDCYPTFDLAKAAVLARAAQSIEQHKTALQRARTRLGELEAMKEPQ